MTNLLQIKWNRLKDQIEDLLVQLRVVGDIPTDRELAILSQVRALKNEASVIKFALEDLEHTDYTNYEITMRMQANRRLFNLRGAVSSFQPQHLHI